VHSCTEREPIVDWGTRQPHPSGASVGETDDERSRRSSLQERLWITAREPVASGEVHDLCEGKALKGGSPGTVAARNKAVELELARNR
jgi:hypothetical protein